MSQQVKKGTDDKMVRTFSKNTMGRKRMGFTYVEGTWQHISGGDKQESFRGRHKTWKKADGI